MATWGERINLPGLVASGDLSAQQFKVVKHASTAGAVVVVNATTDNAIGLLQNDPTDGEAAEVAGLGLALGLAGVNDLAYGERVGYDTTGRLVDHTTDNRRIIGQVQKPSTGVGDEVQVLLTGLARY